MELKELSCNWKKLQKTLQAEGSKTSKSNPLKRKSPNEQPCTTHQRNGVKRQRITSHNPPPRNRQKMDASSQSATQSHLQHTSATLALFAADNDISASSLAAAYHLSPTSTALPASTHHPADALNEGLSPTAVAGRYVALDCEMVGIGPDPGNDSQLARVSLVNYYGHQLYDSYVLPHLPVTDYRTHVSGITAHHLRPGYARPFSVVQKNVAALLEGRILVGHALRHDLGVLMLGHPRRDIRDTARHPAFRVLSQGKTPALKRLAREVLGVEIQGGEHSSVEDARACMLLFRREKEAFETEHLKRWGRPVRRVVEDGTEEGEEEGVKAKAGVVRKKKKKKKGKK